MREEPPFLSNESYDATKNLVQRGLPTLAVLYFIASKIVDLPSPINVLGIIASLMLLLGTVIGLSSIRYNESNAAYDGRLLVREDNGGVAGFTLELDGDPELLADKAVISFKVEREVI